MTELVRRTLKRIVPLCLAVSFAVAPLATRADELSLGSGAPPRSLIGSPSLGAPLGKMSFAGLLALDIPPSGFSIGPRLGVELMYGAMDLAPQVRLDFGGRIHYAYHGADTGGFLGASASSWILDFVPDVKIRYAINDQFGTYGDFGMGLAYMHDSFSVPGFADYSDGSVAMTFQFGGGVSYALTPTINLLGEVRLNVYTKSGHGLYIAIPTVGIEFH